MSKEDREMILPEGFTCGDCFAFTRFCGPLGISKPERQSCDYYPNRFRASLECLERLRSQAVQEVQS